MTGFLKPAALAAAAVLAAAAGPAPGAPSPPDRPALLPSRDAVLGYHLRPATGEPIDVRVMVKAGAKGFRLDLPDTNYILAFPETRTVVLVIPMERTSADLGWQAGPQSLFAVDDRAKLTRRAEMTIAGQKCTQWDAQLGAETRTVCITPDGLMMRNQFLDPMGRRNLVEAFVVRYETVLESDLQVPAGFDQLPPETSPIR